MGGQSFPSIMKSIESYAGAQSSNCLAASLKSLTPRSHQNAWLHGVTGNTKSQWLRNYLDQRCIASPLQEGGTVLLSSQYPASAGGNSVSTYDMVRVYTAMFWNALLSNPQRITALSWSGISDITPIVTTMVYDNARYVDDMHYAF